MNVQTEPKTTPNSRGSALNVRCLTRNSRQRFKAKCAAAGISMEQAVRQFVDMVSFNELDLKELGIRSH